MGDDGMGGLRELPLKKAYSSDFDDILQGFLIPALCVSVSYDRLAGFFSSTALAVAARGIMGLLRNGGTMRLIVSPRLEAVDLEVMLQSPESLQDLLEARMLDQLDQIPDQATRDHVAALAWLLAKRRLEIRVALAYSGDGKLLGVNDVLQSGIFHQKVGVFRDGEGNYMSFSGSVNETASGWTSNIEEIKVFCGWDPLQAEYAQSDVQKFERFWSGGGERIKVIDIPDAVKSRLLSIAPAEPESLALERWYSAPRREEGVKLFGHQLEAVRAWWSNGGRGIFEMATGTGKTYAALGCVRKLLSVQPRLLVTIACPYHHLIEQWMRELHRFGIRLGPVVVADSTNPHWITQLTRSLIDLSLGYASSVLLVTTHSTLSRGRLADVVRETKRGFSAILIADEVHGLGAPQLLQGLTSKYDYRLGLSATPERWFDERGTQVILEYFGGTVFSFDLQRAIRTVNPLTGETYLTPFRYLPQFTSLTEEELSEYERSTRLLAQAATRLKDAGSDQEMVDRLVFKRAAIVKNALGKYAILATVLAALGDSLKWTLIYCTPQQIGTIMQMLRQRRLSAHRFTMKEGTTCSEEFNGLSEREFIISAFAEGKYQVLVAMRCLDEGVDIPPARTAVLMASSVNPREYTQRIGRVLRRFPGKEAATVYDLIVRPSVARLPVQLMDLELRVFQRELLRCEYIAAAASNSAQALKELYSHAQTGGV